MDSFSGVNAISIRPGAPQDAPTVLALFDEAIEWLVDRGQTGQWGTHPFSDRPEGRELVHRLASGGGIRVAELDGQPVGVLVVGSAPDYVPPSTVPETYITLVLTSRQCKGQRIGAQLIDRAVEEAHAAGHEQLRVDCWAGAPSLVAWYESQGFAPSGTFERGGWIGQILSRPLNLDARRPS